MCDFLLQLVYLHRSIWPSSANASLAPHPHLQTSYPFFTYLDPLPLHPHYRLMLLAVSLYLLLPLPLPNSLRVLQWNAGGLRARNTELLHFISSHPVDLICIQESNLNSTSSFRIHGFSALRFDGTHSRSGIFSTDVTDASGGVIIFVRQGLSFSELSTSSLSSLDPYSDYAEVNISFNGSSSLSFLNIYLSSMKDSRTNFLSPSILPSYMEAVEFSRFRRKRTASSFRIYSYSPNLHTLLFFLLDIVMSLWWEQFVPLDFLNIDFVVSTQNPIKIFFEQFWNGVVVRMSASQLVDLGFISLVESYQ